MIHAKDFVHTGSHGVDRSSATNFVVEFRSEFFGAFDDFFTFFVIRIPGIFSFSVGFLTEGRKGHLGEAVFDNFVTRFEFIFFPKI